MPPAIRTVRIGDAAYPANLKTIYDPPKQLYVNGSLKEEDRFAVALVGSRRATPYGLETCEALAYGLAQRGITVVSGLARGIDTAAHRGALKAKGRTIAVMGSGHHDIYPPENVALYGEITRHGAVVTEFENDTPPLPAHFPQRNRIISGLALGIVVVEAARNSGALITASYGLEQGRDVFAVPGRISSQTSAGANELIRDGATMVVSVDDILEALSLKTDLPVSGGGRPAFESSIGRMTQAYIYNSLTEDERKIYKTLSDEPVQIDQILDDTGIPVERGAKVLLSLQLKKLVTELPGKYFIKNGD